MKVHNPHCPCRICHEERQVEVSLLSLQRQQDKLEAAPGKRARRRKLYQQSADRRFKDAANLWDVKS